MISVDDLAVALHAIATSAPQVGQLDDAVRGQVQAALSVAGFTSAEEFVVRTALMHLDRKAEGGGTGPAGPPAATIGPAVLGATGTGPATAHPPTPISEVRSKLVLDQLLKSKGYGDTAESVRTSVARFRRWYQALPALDEYTKVEMHAAKAEGRFAHFIKQMYEHDQLMKFPTFEDYAEAVLASCPEDAPELEALRTLTATKYQRKMTEPAAHVTLVRGLLVRAGVSLESVVATFLFSLTLPHATVRSGGVGMATCLRKGYFERMAVEFLTAEDVDMTVRQATIGTPPVAPQPTSRQLLPPGEPMEIGAVSRAAEDPPSPRVRNAHVVCRRCGGLGHFEKDCATRKMGRSSGNGERA
jgi:Zinc knuckle